MTTARSRVRAAWGTVRAAAATSAVEFAAVHTWRSWTLGWLVRVTSQAVLYGLLGRLLGSGAWQQQLFVGGAVLVCATEALLVCASTVNERRSGALTLLVASPASLFLALLGRGAQWLPGGIVTSLVCLFALGPAFGLRWTATSAAAVVPIVVITAVASYCFGMALGAVVLARPELRNVVSGAAASTLALLGGVAVPLHAWPSPAVALGQCLPLVHTLTAVRAVVDHGPFGAVAAPAALAMAVAAGWLVVAVVAVRRLVAAGRRNGSLELGGIA